MKFKTGDKAVRASQLQYVSNPYHCELATGVMIVKSTNDRLFSFSQENLETWPHVHGTVCQKTGVERGVFGTPETYLHLKHDAAKILDIIDSHITDELEAMEAAGEKKIKELQAEIDSIREDGVMYSIFNVKNMLKKMQATRETVLNNILQEDPYDHEPYVGEM